MRLANTTKSAAVSAAAAVAGTVVGAIKNDKIARDATEVIHARDNWAGLHSYVAKRQDGDEYGTGTAWQDCATQLQGASVVFSATGPGGK